MTPPLVNDDFLCSSSPEFHFFMAQMQAHSEVQSNGNLCFRWDSERTWTLSFRHGRLVWAWPEHSRLRCCKRLLGAPRLELLPHTLSQDACSTIVTWDYELLRRLMIQGKLGRHDINALIRQMILEVLFDLVQTFILTGQKPNITFQMFKLEHPVQFFAPNALMASVQQSWFQWSQARLQPYSPRMAPLIRQSEKLRSMVSQSSYHNLERLLQGQFSLRELATIMNQPLIPLTQTLASYERRCLITFNGHPQPSQTDIVDDASTLTKGSDEVQTAPLALCIDDSELIGKRLGQLVRTAGYRYESLQDSLAGLQRVIEVQPDLIFLDLVMPLISGYELCSQIRRISAFRKVPIVILTSNDGIVDRVRARATGATHFLGKPICPKAIRKLLHQYELDQTAA